MKLLNCVYQTIVTIILHGKFLQLDKSGIKHRFENRADNTTIFANSPIDFAKVIFMKLNIFLCFLCSEFENGWFLNSFFWLNAFFFVYVDIFCPPTDTKFCHFSQERKKNSRICLFIICVNSINVCYLLSNEEQQQKKQFMCDRNESVCLCV